MSERYVRTRGGLGVFVEGHGVVQPGEPQKVTNSEAVEALIGDKVLVAAQPPKKQTTTTDKEGDGS